MDKDYDIVAAFQAIEEELINSMLGNIKRHTDWEKTEGFEWSMWQAEQLMALEKYRSANINKFKGYFSTINEQIEEVLKVAYKEGNMEQEVKILEALREGYVFKNRRTNTLNLTAEFFKVNDRKLNALIKATKDDFEKAQFAMLRMSNDQYRKIIFNAQLYANTGAGTIEKAIDMASKDYMANGINCIEYKNGARVNIVKYVDMAIRTANKRAYLQGEGDKRKEWGISTVVIATRGKGCPKCVPHQGKIYIDDVWSGGSSKDGPYPLLSAAIEKGLYHPNCRDTHTTYFEGITTKPIKPTKEQQEENIRDYNEEQKLRYLERLVEKYKNLEERSFDKENKEKYKSKREEINNKTNSALEFIKAKSVDEAIEFAKKITGNGDFTFGDFSIENMNIINEALYDCYKKINKPLKNINRIENMPKGWSRSMQAAYSNEKKLIYMKGGKSKTYLNSLEKSANRDFNTGFSASEHKLSTLYHEIGHAVYSDLSYYTRNKIKEVFEESRHKAYLDWMDAGGSSSGLTQADFHKKVLSKYAFKDNDPNEFFAEIFSQIVSNRMRPVSRKVYNILKNDYINK